MSSGFDPPESRDRALFAALWAYVSRRDHGETRREDRIYARDGWRCQAPGCSSRRNLEAHHVVHRARGGAFRNERAIARRP